MSEVLHRAEERPERLPNRICDPSEDAGRHRGAVLEAADRRLIETDSIGELVLGQTRSLPSFPDPPSQIRVSHNSSPEYALGACTC